MNTSNIALKEWATVIEALALGWQLLIVRKGGIRDPKGAFQLQHREFLLYPTWEHQREAMIRSVRPEFHERFNGLLSQPQGLDAVSLRVYAGVAWCGEIKDPARLAPLSDYHIWTREFLEERMRYRPQSPTLVAVLRAYTLPDPVRHPVRPEYAGCKSWVTLGEEIPIEKAVPVMDNARFRRALEAITSKME